ncbi:Uncharacterized protein OBRU01_21116 [Operophtera brumata]|uniref:Uncharacterized protein n=1 Tax=Operophtera brumata TaxID=104452 RepID=A0A0L7KTB3_OPEBR|nr:Uncharacterized protein OBRU01_21116 [Operophtera brumata]
MNAQYRAAYAAALCCPLARLSGLTSGAYPTMQASPPARKERTLASYIRTEMERASRIQLQQHAHSSQPGVAGGVQDRPSGVPEPRRWRKVDHYPRYTSSRSQTIGPNQTFEPSQTRTKSQTLGPLDSQPTTEKSRTLDSFGPRKPDTYRRETGSQPSIKITRFQLGNDRQTKV